MDEKFNGLSEKEIGDILARLEVVIKNTGNFEYVEIFNTMRELELLQRHLSFVLFKMEGEYNELQLDFEAWYSILFIDIRDRHNLTELAGSKWLSAKELDCKVIKANEDEYKKRKADLTGLQSRLAYLSRTIKQLDGYRISLQSIVKGLENMARSM